LSIVTLAPARSLACFLALIAMAGGCLPVNAPCKSQDIHGNGDASCTGGPHSYMWNGSACVAVLACSCADADCDKLYPTASSCETAHWHCR
jgi:hypothetical protein